MNVMHDAVNRSLTLIQAIEKDIMINSVCSCQCLLSNLSFVKKILENYQKSSSLSTIPAKVILYTQLLFNTIQEQTLPATTVERINHRLFRIQTLMENTLLIKPKMESVTIDVELVFVCDIDSIDQDGALTVYITRLIINEVAFVTTRSLFSQRYCSSQNTNETYYRAEMEEVLLNRKNQWEIFEQGTEFLIFIPKIKMDHKSKLSALKSFDLKTDQSIRNISLAEVFKPSQSFATLQGFFDLFNTSPAFNKHIFIIGHSDGHTNAGLTSPHYIKFLEFLNEQKCGALSVVSCFSGGYSSMLHYSNQLKDKLNFPVIIHSIGDFPATGSILKNIAHYFKSIKVVLESPGRQTKQKLCNALISTNNKETPRFLNFVQVYFPAQHTLDHFRTINENNMSLSLTWNASKHFEIQIKQKKLPGLCVRHKFIELYLLLVDIPLIISEEVPIFVSLIPGYSFHFLTEVQLKKLTILEFIKSTHRFYKQNQLNVKKLLVIEKLSTDNNIWRQVLILISNRGIESYAYYKEDHYWFESQQKECHVITPLQYTCLLTYLIEDTKPSSAAVYAQTAGQQNKNQFYKRLGKQRFWEHADNVLSAYPQFFNFNELSQLDVKEVDCLVLNFSRQEKESLIFHFLCHQRADLAQSIFCKSGICANICNLEDSPLLSEAILYDKSGLFIISILEKGVHLETLQQALFLATEKSNFSLVKLLLKHPLSDVDAIDVRGRSIIFNAMNKKSKNIFKFLVEKKNAALNLVDHKGWTLLSLCAVFGAKKKMLELLDKKADPNLGQPLPLFWAIKAFDREMIKILLEQGADPFKKRTDDRFSLTEAILNSPQDIIDMFLDEKKFDGYLAFSHFKNDLLMAAFCAGNQPIIEQLITDKACLPYQFSSIEFEITLHLALKRIVLCNNLPLLCKIIKNEISIYYLKNLQFYVNHFIFQNSLHYTLEQIQNLIKEGVLEPDLIFDKCGEISPFKINHLLEAGYAKKDDESLLKFLQQAKQDKIHLNKFIQASLKISDENEEIKEIIINDFL